MPPVWHSNRIWLVGAVPSFYRSHRSSVYVLRLLYSAVRKRGHTKCQCQPEATLLGLPLLLYVPLQIVRTALAVKEADTMMRYQGNMKTGRSYQYIAFPGFIQY